MKSHIETSFTNSTFYSLSECQEKFQKQWQKAVKVLTNVLKTFVFLTMLIFVSFPLFLLAMLLEKETDED